ncbi:conserved hypothetical protein [Paraburkholderia caribensis]|nr:conserved hypothetical protein [Paraburkholderia caribensis]
MEPKGLARLLSDGKSDLFFLYPSFFNGTARLTGLSPEELLLRHTVFRYAAIGLKPDRRALLAKQLLAASARGNSVRLRATLGLHVEALSFRRYCQQCREEDIRRFGESYWHTCHALPGVFNCTQHSQPLQVTALSVTPKLSASTALLPQEIRGDIVDWALEVERMTRLAFAVLHAMSLPAEAWAVCCREYRALADVRARKCEQRHWRLDPMAIAFGEFYGVDFLERIGLTLSSLGCDAWPVKMARGAGPPVLLPLRHILLRVFLEHFCPEPKI